MTVKYDFSKSVHVSGHSHPFITQTNHNSKYLMDYKVIAGYCLVFTLLVVFVFFSQSLVSLPALEWALPTSTDQYELLIEVQPRQHHRAHYETEGSRGAVKAVSGGHPVVKVHS